MLQIHKTPEKKWSLIQLNFNELLLVTEHVFTAQICTMNVFIITLLIGVVVMVLHDRRHYYPACAKQGYAMGSGRQCVSVIKILG